MRAATELNDIRRDLVGLLPKLRRFALTLTGNPADADHLVQDVCDRATAGSHDGSGQSRLDGWLYGLAHALWLDDARTRSGDGMPAAQDARAFIDSGNSGETDEMRAMILGLPDGSASIFLLVAVEGRSYNDAADILQIPAETAMRRLSAARLRLAAMVPATGERRA